MRRGNTATTRSGEDDSRVGDMHRSRKILDKIADNISNLKSEGVQQGIGEALDAGLTPLDIIRRGVSLGMKTVGKK